MEGRWSSDNVAMACNLAGEARNGTGNWRVMLIEYPILKGLVRFAYLGKSR